MEFSEVGVEAADNRRQPDPHDGAAEGNRAESVCEGREARPLSFPMSRDKIRRFMQGGPSRRLVRADRGPVLAVGRACERRKGGDSCRVRRASKAKHPAMRHGKPPQPLCNSEVRGREC